MSGRIVLAGGGTAGHVNPLLATAQELSSRGYDITVIGTREGLEFDLVPAAGFDLRVIPRIPFPRRPSPQVLTFPGRFSKAIDECVVILQGAEVLVGFGGYVSAPAYWAANRLNIPIVIHEQNARPGLANRLGVRTAQVVALTFDSTPLSASRGKTLVTGLPLRPAIQELAKQRATEQGAIESRAAGAARLGVDANLPTILITGGSLGAVHINEVASQAAAQLPEGTQVVHLTGRGKDQPVREAVDAAGLGDRWIVMDYLFAMEDALAVADLVVCRSGAGTVAEMTALGLPCIYIPLPFGNGEQRLNARDHVAAGGALMIDDSRFNVEDMYTHVFDLVRSPQLKTMKDASVQLGHVDAAEHLASLVCELAESRGIGGTENNE